MGPVTGAPDLRGLVVAGDGRGRGLGWPTANVAAAGDGIADGIYAAWARFSPDEAVHPATVSVGHNPTFGDVRERRVEVHVHDAELALYGRTAEVWLVHRIRPMVRFPSEAELIDATARDVARSRALLAAQGRPRS